MPATNEDRTRRLTMRGLGWWPCGFRFVNVVLVALALLAAACSTDPGVGVSGTGGSSGSGAGAGNGSTGGAGGFGLGTGGAGGGFVFRASDAGPSSGGQGGNPDDKNCGLERYMLQRLPPELLIVLDRSASMHESVPGGGTRWAMTSAALDEVVMKTNATASWGLKFFPSPLNPKDSEGCSVSQAIEVPVAASNYAAIAAKIKATPPYPASFVNSNTPTHLAIKAATAYMKTLTSKNPKFIMLATDGEPNCFDKTIMPAEYLSALQDAAAAGVKTFVVGVNTSTMRNAPAVLDMMAVMGGEPRQGTPKHYSVESKQELVDTLVGIATGVSNCYFPLSKAPPSPNDVAVKIEGTRIPPDTAHMNGWDYAGADRMAIQIYGSTCDALKAGKISNVQIIFGCPGVVIE